MSPRWLVCLVLGLATPVVHAQTAPAAAPDSEFAGDMDVEEELAPTAPSPPPPLPEETPTARPFADAVWTSGHWYWDDSQWRFKPGAWIAKMPGYQFVNGYWQQDGYVWRWISGGWASPGSMEVEIPIDLTSEEVTTTQAPPQLQVEAPPPAPEPNLTWAPGYWFWSGTQWAWVGGSWVAPPRPGLVFVSPRWVRRGPMWVFVDGGWAVRGSVRVVVPEYRHAGITVRWGHPHYFFHTWRRYPMVRHYHYRGWSAPRYHRGPRYHDASPSREHRWGGRHHR
ncbi:hypothetical protein F0U61_30215 [Archangium violaceum]|nr:hypothetical protein F0U61_30215 [Archangium violaceum]